MFTTGVIVLLICILVAVGCLLVISRAFDKDLSSLELVVRKIENAVIDNIWLKKESAAFDDCLRLTRKNAALEKENEYLRIFEDFFKSADIDTQIITFKGEHYRITDVYLSCETGKIASINVTAMSDIQFRKE